jgi:prevent-host-death family protein
MNEVSIAEVRDNLADALNRVAYAGERIVLTRRGKGVAVLVSMEDFDQLRQMEDKADLLAARKAQKEKGGITLDAYRKKHGL